MEPQVLLVAPAVTVEPVEVAPAVTVEQPRADPLVAPVVLVVMLPAEV
jgi:hypothetical protein